MNYRAVCLFAAVSAVLLVAADVYYAVNIMRYKAGIDYWFFVLLILALIAVILSVIFQKKSRKMNYKYYDQWQEIRRIFGNRISTK